MTAKSPPDITVFDIADWFLAKAEDEGKPLKHMKLQKLVYFAYGWYSAYHDVPLFRETICAWQHGPVVEELYQKYKPFKKYPIEVADIVSPQVDEDVLSILVEVWETYSHCTDTHLRNITHRPDAPWSKVYNSRDWSIEIPLTDIRDYFTTLKDKFNNDPA
jgi:uncharacterized phage-associated protein